MPRRPLGNPHKSPFTRHAEIEQRGACFRSFALLADGSSDTCELCYGRRDRDNYELIVGVPERWRFVFRAYLVRGEELVL